MEKVHVPIAEVVEGSCNLEVSAANNPGDDMANIDSNRHLVFSLRIPKKSIEIAQVNHVHVSLESSHGENLLDHLVRGRGHPQLVHEERDEPDLVGVAERRRLLQNLFDQPQNVLGLGGVALRVLGEESLQLDHRVEGSASELLQALAGQMHEHVLEEDKPLRIPNDRKGKCQRVVTVVRT